MIEMMGGFAPPGGRPGPPAPQPRQAELRPFTILEGRTIRVGLFRIPGEQQCVTCGFELHKLMMRAATLRDVAADIRAEAQRVPPGAAFDWFRN